MFETAAADLFHSFVKTDLIAQGWTIEQVLTNAYVLKGNDGVEAFASCHVEQYLNADRYSVFLKFDWDNLAPIGTVAKVDGSWKIFKLEQ